MLLAMICILVFSFILKHPVLDALHVQQADAIEGLSIPAQQIARVITDQGELTEEDRALLSHVVDLDQVAQTYEPYISDPIKNLVRAKNQEDYIREPTWTPEGLEFPVTIPGNHVFVLGDNRNNSSDSRHIDLGPIDERMMMGKAVFLAIPGKTADLDAREWSRIGLIG